MFPVYALERITISIPGPYNLSYLPIDLIPMIGVDREEGVRLRILHTGGGSLSLEHLINHNVDFAVAGAPAAMSLRAKNVDIVLIAAVDDAPSFVLMVRTELSDQVRRISDLKGKVIGVNTSTLGGKTTSQQLLECLLTNVGVALNAVHIVSAGQSWEQQSMVIESNSVDALMGDEPFALRLWADGKIFFLASLGEPETTKNIPGLHFLHATLETRNEVIAESPEKVTTMVRILKKCLTWITNHTPEQVVEALKLSDRDAQDFLILSLKTYPQLFSREGSFSTSQLQETEKFFYSNPFNNAKSMLHIEDIVNDHWAGRKP